MDGLARDAGRLGTLPPHVQGLVFAVIWILVRAEIIRFALQRARRYGIPGSELEEIIAKAEEKLIARLQSDNPPTFTGYGQFAAYINTATTNTALTAKAKLTRRPIVGSLGGRCDIPCRPTSCLRPKSKSRCRPSDPDAFSSGRD